MKERVLVTGATGFIGGATYNGLDRKVYNPNSFVGDVTKVEDWQKNLKVGEIIFLIAGVRTETDTDFAVNTNSIESLFEVALKMDTLPKRVILASSQAVYMGNDVPFKEPEEPLPTTTYGQSKLLGERVAQGWCQEFDVPLVILRYSTVLGSGVKEKSNMSGPLFVWVKAAFENAPIKVYQDGNQSRDYVHVDDVVRANILAIDLPNGIYNVGGGKPIKLLELANWIKEAVGSNSQIDILGGDCSKSDPREMFSDTTKIKSHGWKPKSTAKQAVEEFVASQKTL